MAGNRKGRTVDTKSNVAAQDKNETKKVSGATVMPDRTLHLQLHDLHAYGQAKGGGVDMAQLARVVIDKVVIYDNEFAGTLLTEGLIDAAPPKKEQLTVVEEFNNKVIQYNKDLAAWYARQPNAGKAAPAPAPAAEGEAESEEPADSGDGEEEEEAPPPKKASGKDGKDGKDKDAKKDLKPDAPVEPDPKKSKEGAAIEAVRAWIAYYDQVKAALGLEPYAATKAQIDAELKKELTRSGFDKPELFTFENAKHRAHLNKHLETRRSWLQTKKGRLSIPLFEAKEGQGGQTTLAKDATTVIEFELANLKFTEPKENIAEIGLDLGFAARSAHFNRADAEKDWFLKRDQKSAWKVKDGKAEKPLYNWWTLSHTWKHERGKPELDPVYNTFVLQWCQPVWYQREGRHGSAPIVPLPVPIDSNQEPKKPGAIAVPLLDDGEWGKIPTMLISTSDTVPHGRQYGRHDRAGRSTDCLLQRELKTWRKSEKDPLWYLYPQAVPIALLADIVWHPGAAPKDAAKQNPDHPPSPEPACIRTFKKKTPPQREMTPKEKEAAAKAEKAGKKPVPLPDPVPIWEQIDPKGETPAHVQKRLSQLDTKATPRAEGAEVTARIYENGTQDLAAVIPQMWVGNGGDGKLKKKSYTKDTDHYRRMIIQEKTPDGKVLQYRVVEFSDKQGRPSTKPDYKQTFPAGKPRIIKRWVSDPNKKGGGEWVEDDADDGTAAARELARWRWHKGVDVAGYVGWPLFAIRGGRIEHTGEYQSSVGGKVTLFHPGRSTSYAHCDLDNDKWKEAAARSQEFERMYPKRFRGSPVKAGDIIALMGRTGEEHADMAATHCHMGNDCVQWNWPESHKWLLPHNDMTEELSCQTEFGRRGGRDGVGKLCRFPATRTVNSCYGRTLKKGDPVPMPTAAVDPRPHEGSDPNPNPNFNKPVHAFEHGGGCWAFNQRMCPRQKIVEEERDLIIKKRREDAEAEAAKKAKPKAKAK